MIEKDLVFGLKMTCYKIGLSKDFSCDSRKRSSTNQSNDSNPNLSLIDVNRSKLRKIFEKHAFQGSKNIEKDELIKLFKN